MRARLAALMLFRPVSITESIGYIQNMSPVGCAASIFARRALAQSSWAPRSKQAATVTIPPLARSWGWIAVTAFPIRVSQRCRYCRRISASLIASAAGWPNSPAGSARARENRIPNLVSEFIRDQFVVDLGLLE